MSTSPTPRPVHFYHCWCGPDDVTKSFEIVREHFRLLTEAEFDGDVEVGVVGPKNRREWLVSVIEGVWSKDFGIIAQAEEGYEQVTLKALHEYARQVPSVTPILYTHSKGAYHPAEFQDRWRNHMDTALIIPWEARVAELETHDAVGLHWLTPETPSPHGLPWLLPSASFFGGNFWWANAGYLAGLPVPDGERYDAEAWIGMDYPKVLDLKPGWPLY